MTDTRPINPDTLAREFLDLYSGGVVGSRFINASVTLPVLREWFRRAMAAAVTETLQYRARLDKIDAAKARVRAAMVPYPLNGIILRENGHDTVIPDSPVGAESPSSIIRAVLDVLKELHGAQSKFPAYHSAHEGHSVILEEFKELEAEVFRNPLKDNFGNKLDPQSEPAYRAKRLHLKDMRTEAMQVATTAIRFMVDVTPDMELR